MTKQETIIAPIEQVPFDDLYVSDLNPRTVFSPEGIEALAENIRQLGLIQNLAGLRDETGKVGIVAGGRRLRALALLHRHQHRGDILRRALDHPPVLLRIRPGGLLLLHEGAVQVNNIGWLHGLKTRPSGSLMLRCNNFSLALGAMFWSVSRHRGNL